jgi:hypothetical protein
MHPLIDFAGAVSKPQGISPWKDAVEAFFAGVSHEIGNCSVHSKLVLSDSGKMFAQVKAAGENYR